jgi:quercetin dioxygenase-like cupin family protein
MAKCQLFSFENDLVEMVPDGLYMRSLVGETLSIGVVKFTLPGAAQLPSKHHSHGEEASFQIRGGCMIHQGETGSEPRFSMELDAGRVMIIPADEPHYGDNRYDEDGVSMRLNVATPPRADYGTKDKPQVFYHPLEDKA